MESLRFRLVLSCILACVAGGSEAARRESRVFPGPVKANVLRVLDGDTFVAEAHLWPGQDLRINVRIRGIDAPEMKSRCQMERILARQARDMLEELVDERPVVISNIAGAKYYGRVLADVHSETGEALGPALLSLELVRAYAGGRRKGWCG